MANIVRTDPFEDFLRGFFVRPVGLGHEESALPEMRVDIRENTEAYVVHAELPGVRKEDIQVSIDGNVLTIAAERRQEKDTKDGERLLRAERSWGRVSRSFQVGADMDEAQSKARFTDGVLELTLPKKSAPQARRLTIE